MVRRRAHLWLVFGLLAFLSACASTPDSRRSSAPQPRGGADGANPHYKVGSPYKIKGRTYVPKVDKSYNKTGLASWYGDQFQGRPTANGEIFDKALLSAAHKTLPLPIIAEVKNLENGRKIIVRVNDRGPFVDDRIIDLSEAAARELGFQHKGLARVRVKYLRDANVYGVALAPGERPGGTARRQRYAENTTTRSQSNGIAPQADIRPATPSRRPYATRPAAPYQARANSEAVASPSIASHGLPNDESRSASDRGAQAVGPPTAAINQDAQGAPQSSDDIAALIARSDTVEDDETTAISSDDRAPAGLSPFGASHSADEMRSYWVELVSVSDLSRLEAMRASLEGLGAIAVFSEGENNHIIRLGPYARAGDASRAQSQAAAAGFAGASILQINSP